MYGMRQRVPENVACHENDLKRSNFAETRSPMLCRKTVDLPSSESMATVPLRFFPCLFWQKHEGSGQRLVRQPLARQSIFELSSLLRNLLPRVAAPSQAHRQVNLYLNASFVAVVNSR